MRRSAVISARKFVAPMPTLGPGTGQAPGQTPGQAPRQAPGHRPDPPTPPPPSPPSAPNRTGAATYVVVWSKKTTKKHKTWEGDGTLVVTDRSAVLKDVDGKELGRKNRFTTDTIQEGAILSIGNKHVQIIEMPEAIATQDSNKRKVVEGSPADSRPVKKTKKAFAVNFLSHLNKHRGVLSPYKPLKFPAPTLEHQQLYNAYNQPLVDLYVDPCLARVLRPHQRTGVVFLYECVMGYRNLDYYGAILADEMGLGKTLQCITLVWTMLKQGPYGGCPVIKKVLIVAPSSLIGNWQKEFGRWLGRERIRIFMIDSKNKPSEFGKTDFSPVMIMSYEMCVRYSEDLNSIPFDLILCDEGHRLKNNNIKMSLVLNQLDCKRRIILSGTPVQNDLQEFYSLVNFVNPGILGSAMEYRKYYEEPIKQSREPGISEDVQGLGEERARCLNKETSYFIMRRTQEVLDKYLPTKTEIVIFCQSSELQRNLYTSALEYWTDSDCSKDVMHLVVLTALKKICNHPALLDVNPNDQNKGGLMNHLREILPEQTSMSIEDSGKLKVLDRLLRNLQMKKEKIVIISYFQQTLDLIGELCEYNNFSHCRLDGSTLTSKRTEIVEQFNNVASETFVFLLSAKAGGVGLNLVGASRLVLYDSDWNPASDQQAMSRIWRDGQKKSVFLYRFLTAGTIEEKVFQRQISKTGLSGAVVDPDSGSSIKLSEDELKDLFSLQFDTDCLTHDSLNCECELNGTIPCPLDAVINNGENIQNLRMNQLMQWEHHGLPFDENVMYDLGLSEAAESISFMFCNKCNV